MTAFRVGIEHQVQPQQREKVNVLCHGLGSAHVHLTVLHPSILANLV